MFGLAFLIVCGLYVTLALFVAKRIGRHRNKTIAKLVTLVVFTLIPTWDIIPGQLYHAYLCKTHGGVKVLKTIEMEKIYFLPDGQPDEKKLLEVLDWQTTVDRSYSKIFHIARYQATLFYRKDRSHLGTVTDFWYYGGWFKK